MAKFSSVIETPWDSRALGIATFEIKSLSEEVLKEVATKPGHFTAKVSPLASKKMLHDYGFYYSDTLIEPYCTLEKFIPSENQEVLISRSAAVEDLVAISRHAFIYGRFHRDFNIDEEHADLRYVLWLKDLYNSGDVFGLMYHDELVGFFGYSINKIVLHALSEKYRGRGLAKSLWSAACKELFGLGHREIISSISVSNVAVLNLYASLGFRFRNPLDVYHLFNK
jgi:ribosomal protein S18 acetylase RimI-like enzyme